MEKLIVEIKKLEAKRDDMLEKYGDACTHPKSRIVRGTYSKLCSEITRLILKGVELYGLDFIYKI